MDNRTKLLIVLLILNLILVGSLLYYKNLIPSNTSKDFKIIAYTLEGHPSLGHIKFVIECQNTGLEKEYMIRDGRFYFLGYVDNKTVSGEEGAWVGGISCTPPFYKS